MKPSAYLPLIPLFRLSLLLTAGMLTALHTRPFVNTDTVILMMAAAIAGAFLFLRDREMLSSLCLFACTFLLGACLMWHSMTLHQSACDASLKEMQLVIASSPQPKTKVVSYEAWLCEHGRWYTVRLSLMKDVGQPWQDCLQPGQCIAVKGRVEAPRYTSADASVLVFPGQARPTAACDAPLPSVRRLRLAALHWRERLIARLPVGDPETYGVVLAMTLGDKTRLEKDVRELYSRAGTAHLLALSGLHLSILYGMMSVLVRWRRKQLVILPLIWAYAVMTGLSPSIVRAALMLSICGWTDLTFRSRQGLNTLALAAVIMLTVSPRALTDVSFQLSFMAVLGIFLIRFRPGGRLWGMLTVSLAAQVMTAPLVALYFGRLPVCGLPVNLVAIPLVTLVLWLCPAVWLTAPWPVVQAPLAGTVCTLLDLLHRIIRQVTALPLASVDIPPLTVPQVIAAYVLIFSLLYIRVLLKSFNSK